MGENITNYTSSFVGNKGRTGRFAVYISGVRVPAVSVTVTNTNWQFPQAVIQLPPDRNLMRLGTNDRAHVAVFFRDTYYTPDDPKYRILFDGEIMGWSYAKSGSSTNITFNAIHFPFVFTQFFFEHVYDVNQMILSRSKIDGTPTSQMYSLAPVTPFSLFTKGLKGEEALIIPKQFIEQVIDIMNLTITAYGESVGTNTAITEFFINYIEAYKLKSRIGVTPLIDDKKFTVLNHMADAQLAQMLAQTNKVAGSHIQAGSMWDYLTYMFKVLFHEIHMTSTPKDGAIEDIITKPQTYFSAVPRSNTFFPSMITNFSFEEDYWSSPTRTFCREPSPHMELLGVYGDQVGTALATILGTRASPEALRAKLVEHNTKEGQLSTWDSFSNLPLTPEELAKGPVVNNVEAGYFYRYISEHLTDFVYEKDSVDDVAEGFRTSAISKGGERVDPLQIFADYSHEKMRATSRRGSIQMAFNPYVIHGFPCIVFDGANEVGHMQGYVESVTHVLTTNSSSTSVSVSGFSPLKSDGKLEDIPYLPNLKELGSDPDKSSADVIIGGMFGSPNLGANSYEVGESVTSVEVSTTATGESVDPTAAQSTETGEDTVVERTVNTGLPAANNVYHHRDILGEKVSDNVKAKEGFTNLGARCVEDFDFAMEQYCARPIATIDTYLNFFGAEGRYLDPKITPAQKIKSGDNPNGTGVEAYEEFYPWASAPEGEAAAPATPLPWTRVGSNNGEWASRVRKVAARVKKQGVFFDG